MTQQQHYSRLLSCLILTIGLFCNPLSQTVQGQCTAVNVQDSLALVALYNATDGVNWSINTNWLIGTVGTWHGVTLTDDGCGVSKIALGNNDLIGEIPPELGNLPNLLELNLYFNELTIIPPELGNLPNLTSLNLSYNQLTIIPPELGNLPNLTSLNLSNTQLTIIPSELGSLPNLTFLNLSSNQLTIIPPELGDLPNLTTLYLYFNELTIIPPELGNLLNLTVLGLASNQLSGCIPPELQALCIGNTAVYIGSNPDLDTQDWSAFCDTDEGMCTIVSCDVTASAGTVSIQSGLEGYTESISLFCGDADVRLDVAGTIMPNDSYESVFMVTDAALNIVAYASSSNAENGVGLFGVLPAGDYSGWYVVYSTTEFPALPPIWSNAAVLTGAAGDGSGCLALSTPVNFSVAEIIELNILGFECVPDEGYYPIVQGSGGCPEVTGFGSYSMNSGFIAGSYVDGVGIEGVLVNSVPIGAGQTVTLSVTADGCTCGSEPVEATAPAAVCGPVSDCDIIADSLALVALYNATNGANWTNNSNWSTGSLNTWEGVMLTSDECGIEKLFLFDNNLVGSIPSELGNLLNLEWLDLSGNEITNIPSELGNLLNLEWLDLSDNEITNIPSELSNLLNLESLNLSDNQISFIPTEWSNLSGLDSVLYLYNNQLVFDDLIWVNQNFPIILDFRYAPQDTISTSLSPNATSLYVTAGDVANNTYTWYEVGNPVFVFETIADSLFTPPADGTYYCDVTNSVMTNPDEESQNLVLTSEPYDFILSNIQLKAYLEGAYDTLLNNMTNELQNLNLLPNQQPYGSAPWNYLGIESVNDFADLGAIVDWVLVELKTITGEDTVVVAQQAALLKIDGNIVDVQGSPMISFEDVDSTNDHYVILRHRNHLDVASAITHNLSTTPYLDFTIPANVLDGINQLTEVELNTYAMRAGDFDGNGVFNGSDYNMWSNASPSLHQYALEDCNFDGNIFIHDHTFFMSNSTVTGEAMVRYFVVQNQACTNAFTIDSLVLVAFYNATDGANWTYTDTVYYDADSGTNMPTPNWGNPWLTGPMSTWHGVDLTNDECEVEKIILENVGLSGSIPVELLGLTDLTVLSFAQNELSGNLLSGLSNLSNLTQLNLSDNQLSGCIPDALQVLCGSTFLDISNNPSLYTQSWSAFCAGEIGACGACESAIVQDSLVLVELYNATDGANWTTNTNWLTGTIDTWHGVTLSSEGCNVTALNLANNNLFGQLPSDLGNLSLLDTLQLRNNELSGNMPLELGNLSNLIVLDLSVNELSGGISPELVNLSNLSILDLSANMLEGNIPTQLGELGSLTTLHLNNNELDGGIPIAFSNLGNLDSLNLSTNQLSGCLTPALQTLCGVTVNITNNPNLGSQDWTAFCTTDEGACTVCTVVNTIDSITLVVLYEETDGDNWTNNDNWLEGPLSTWYGVTLTNDDGCEVAELTLGNNNLVGTIPSELSDFSALTTLALNNNQLTGCIPNNLQELCGISVDITGNLGLSTSNWNAFCFTAEGGCNACAAIDDLDSLALVAFYYATDGPNWTYSDQLYYDYGYDVSLPINNLGNPWLEGPISTWHGIAIADDGCSVDKIILEDVGLTGSLPIALTSLNSLTMLSLVDNALEDSIPPELANLTNLSRLYLSNNEFSGKIPSELANLINLHSLALDGNQLTGGIPLGITDLTNLHGLYLNHNELSGAIPMELSNLSNLTKLYLNNNGLSDTIPRELGSLTHLTELYLSYNELSGTIPSELGNLTNLTELYLKKNHLNDTIPSTLGNLSKLIRLYLDHNELSGSIPPELSNLTNLRRLYLAHNELTGIIYPELGNLTNLINFSLATNNLSGNIPPELENLTNLAWLYLNNNLLSGPIPPELGGLLELDWLFLSNNQLSGCIPDELQALCGPVSIGDIDGNPDLDTQSWSAFCAEGEGACSQSIGGVQIALTAYLEGAFEDTTDTEMHNKLQTAGLLPNDQPYDMLPWDYSGTENLTDLPSSVAVVDWVLVELDSIGVNEQGDLDTFVVAQQAALLTRTGEVVNTLGQSTLRFEGVDLNDSCYVLLRHRNHLDVASVMSYDLSVGSLNLDFSDSTQVLQADNGNALNQLIEVSTATGIQALRAGDFDGNGVFNIADYNRWLVKNPTFSQYVLEDCNLDGLIFVQDHSFLSANYTVIGIPMVKY